MMLTVAMAFDLGNITGEEIMMTIVGMGVVFIALFIIFLVFQNLPKLLRISFRKRKKSDEQKVVEQPVQSAKKEMISGETNAAISAAIYLYFNELHDEEDTILTIQKVSRTYSPWSSKIYSVMNFRR